MVHYPKEYKLLVEKKTILSSSSILSLNPFLNKDGIIRCCGGLESSPGLSYDDKHTSI